LPQNDKNNREISPEAKSPTGILDQAEKPRQTGIIPVSRPGRSGQAADEARQLLDEIAGLSSEERFRHAAGREKDIAGTVRAILLWPFLLAWNILKFIITPLHQADFRLAGEMRKFLKNPGHFFWFNRIAPEAAARHFGTSSTDAMAHHARRYGAHTAMLVLALVVVFFGGFTGLVTEIISEDAIHANPLMVNGNMVITGDSREIYANAVAANSAGFVRRVETVVIKDGDSLQSLAANHNISLETLMYANNLVEPDSPLTPGQKLVVPPITGMLHIGNPGDTVGSVANKYGVDPQAIIAYKFNNLDGADPGTPLKSLQEVMVPGGSMPLRDKLYLYTVRSGDTLQSVAAKFNISTDTLLDNNQLDSGLRIGQQIRILPTDGVIYTVKNGDTLDGIANYLGTSADNIINFKSNNVARGIKLTVGASLVVPGGSWPPPPPPKPADPTPTPKPAQTAKAITKGSAPAVAPLPNKATPKPAAAAPAKAPVPAKAAQKPVAVQAAPSSGKATGSMIWPLRGVITTYFGVPIWYGIHAGLDISSGCGPRVVAADGGTVIEAGWSQYGYGITALIDHGNGFRTRYGHFSRIAVSLGQRVSRGQLVGYEGTTGNSTGCHLHFETILNGKVTNPLRWLP
jgi:murein DD-endopeptidase MepM/ murein hydrolase activator NlpD